MLNITSLILIAKILPNIKLQTSVFSPVVTDVTATPIAKALEDIIAIALSLFILWLFPTFNSNIATIITAGIAIGKVDVAPSPTATVVIPKPT